MFFFYIKKSPPPNRAPSELIPALPASSGFIITLGTPKSFKCSRKDKFGLNMQAICDHKFRIRWIDLTWPGNSSDYMAWVTSDFYHELNTNPWQHILHGMTILGDSAYIKSPFMSVPFKNFVTADKDAYNFYQSQLRITVEQTFGILVH